jgi:hypothetical protein
VVAREGDEQEAQEVRPHRPLETLERGSARLDVEGAQRQAVSKQQRLSPPSRLPCGVIHPGPSIGRGPILS